MPERVTNIRTRWRPPEIAFIEEDRAALEQAVLALEGPSYVTEKEADCWLLGPKAIQAGSLHCDLWRGYAVDLAGHDSIAV